MAMSAAAWLTAHGGGIVASSSPDGVTRFVATLLREREVADPLGSDPAHPQNHSAFVWLVFQSFEAQRSNREQASGGDIGCCNK